MRISFEVHKDLILFNFEQSKTNRRRANEPQRHNIMAEDENASGFIV
jgi:hypothetical protein